MDSSYLREVQLYIKSDLNFICSFSVATLTEDFCGVEPVTHPPIEVETRPPPLIDEDKLRRAYSRVDAVFLGGKNNVQKNILFNHFIHFHLNFCFNSIV